MDNHSGSTPPFLRRYNVVLFFAALKLLLHLFANTRYGFHRDEFLYLEQGRHLSWGYMECPPLIGVLAALTQVFNAPLGLVRLLPTLAGVGIIMLIGKAVMDLGGSKWAQALACLGYLASSAFLRCNMLFQPVTFDQLFWFLLAFSILYLIKTRNPVYWYWAGLFAGLGLMAKYSMAFYLAAFLGALLFSQERRWFKSFYPWIAMGIALAIFLPNLYWQISHRLPVLTHMQELQETQLKHVEIGDFIFSQFLMQVSVLPIWLAGLLALFGSRWKPYRPVGLAFLLSVGILIVLRGKSYYTLGAYPVLFIFGGLALDRVLVKSWYKYALSTVVATLSVMLLPYALPVLPLLKMEAYCAWMKDHFGLAGPLYWEDGSLHSLPQDYADMNGWEEMVQRLSDAYHRLPEAEQATCMLYGGSYGHTAPVAYYREKYSLPQIYSLHNSSIAWMPDSAHFDRLLVLDDVRITESQHFKKVILLDSIRDPYAREKGYLYYQSEPRVNPDSTWRELVLERKKRYGF